MGKLEKRLFIFLLIFLFLLPSCVGGKVTPLSPSGQESPIGETPKTSSETPPFEGETPVILPGEKLLLPQPSLKGPLSLEEVLKARRSVRVFQEKELSLKQVGQLLWAAQGITSPDGKRTAPSAGALYPLEVYYFCSQFWGRYDPEEHSLEVLGRGDKREEISRASFNQSWIAQAPGIFVIVGFVERTAVKYGERAERYVTLEAGHACQNILLEAVALGLGGTSVGAFWDDEINSILKVQALPLYVVPVGYPKE